MRRDGRRSVIPLPGIAARRGAEPAARPGARATPAVFAGAEHAGSGCMHCRYGCPQAAPPPARSAWIGGQGTAPYEQKTQQSPGFGRNVVPQPVQT